MSEVEAMPVGKGVSRVFGVIKSLEGRRCLQGTNFPSTFSFFPSTFSFFPTTVNYTGPLTENVNACNTEKCRETELIMWN